MSLLFGRDDDSKQLAQQLFAPKSHKSKSTAKAKLLPIELLEDMTTGQHLRDFPAYRFHLAYLQQSMQQWKPRSFSELFSPGYFDRLSWFTAVFGLVFGLIGLLSLVTSVIQVALAVAAWKKPTPSV
jgi:hypothetical protein